MSLDIDLVIDEHISVWDGNVTYNLVPMWAGAGFWSQDWDNVDHPGTRVVFSR